MKHDPGENKDSCDMVRVDAIDQLYGAGARPGMFFWGVGIATKKGKEKRYRLCWHILPDGSLGSIPIEPIPDCARAHWTHGGKCHTWQWDGNEDRPTLRPSVHFRGHWHGHFTAGRMRSV